MAHDSKERGREREGVWCVCVSLANSWQWNVDIINNVWVMNQDLHICVCVCVRESTPGCRKRCQLETLDWLGMQKV